MIKRFLSAGALAFISTASCAADLTSYPSASPVPEQRWTGFHVGVSGGNGFNADDPSYSYVNVPPDAVPILPSSANLDADGAIVGGSVGYDKQFGDAFVGIEGDMSWTDFGGDAVHTLVGDPSTGFPTLRFETDYQMDWLSTVRARAGLALDHWMFYATGGLAFAKVSLDSSVTVGDPPMGVLRGSRDETKSGWTAGGGGAVAVTSHVSLKGEMLYYDVGHISVRADSSDDAQNSIQVTEQDLKGMIVRGGIDYKF